MTGAAQRNAYKNSLRAGSGLGVLLGVVAARLNLMMFGVARVTMGRVRMVCRLLVITGFMKLGGLAMVLGGVLMMFGRLVVMLGALMLAHVASPG